MIVQRLAAAEKLAKAGSRARRVFPVGLQYGSMEERERTHILHGHVLESATVVW